MEKGVFNHSYLYCVDAELGWGNRSYFTFFSQLNRGVNASVFACLESAVLILFFLLSTVSNVLIFYTLSSNRRLRTVTNYFVCNLSLADVCFTLCCPLVAVIRVTGTWTLGSFACKTVVYLSCVCGFVSIWTLTLISIDRYTCIVRSSKRRISPPVALVLIAAVWIFTLAAFTPLLMYFVVKDCSYGTDVVSICTLGWPRTPGVSIPVVFTSIVCGLGFIAPIVILIVSHVCIFVKVHKVRLAMARQRQRRASVSSSMLAHSMVLNTHPSCPNQTVHTHLILPHNGQGALRLMPPGVVPKLSGANEALLPTNSASTTTSTTPTTSTSTLDAKRRRSTRDLQLMKTLLFLVLLFFVMWAPIFVVFVLIMRDAYYDVMQVSSQTFLGAMCVAYCNAVLNPLAYGLSTDKLRIYICTLLSCSGKLLRSASPLKTSQGVRAGSAGGDDVNGGVHGLRNWFGRMLKTSGGSSMS